MTRNNLRSHSRCAFTYFDLMVLLVLLPLVGVGCWHGTCRSRETANRVKCASNLRQIGQAMLLYSNANGGHYPRTVYVPGQVPVFGTGAGAPDPFKEGVPQPNDVTAAMFLLLRTQDITSEVFTCPSSNHEKDTFDGKAPIDRSNFTDVKKNLSYSLHNPYPDAGVIDPDDKTWWTNAMRPEFAVAADINPGTTPRGDDVLLPTTSSSAKEMRNANSSNHDKDGQNILYADGHVAWESNPFVAVNRDHIYTTPDKKVLSSPVDANDSLLLPTDD